MPQERRKSYIAIHWELIIGCVSIIFTIVGVAYYQSGVDTKQTEIIAIVAQKVDQFDQKLDAVNEKQDVVDRRTIANSERINALERTVYKPSHQP